MCFGGSIHILSATFGRQEKNICSGYGNTRNTNCVTSAIDVIRFDCENTKFCTISAQPGKYGDPCRGTSKYLKVKYICGPDGKMFTF